MTPFHLFVPLHRQSWLDSLQIKTLVTKCWWCFHCSVLFFFFFPRKRCSAVTSERSARQRVLSPPRPPLRQRVPAHPPGPGWSCGLRRRRQQQRAVPRDITPELQPRSELPAFLGLVGWLRWRSQDPPAAGRAAPPARGGESPRKSRGEEKGRGEERRNSAGAPAWNSSLLITCCLSFLHWSSALGEYRERVRSEFSGLLAVCFFTFRALRRNNTGCSVCWGSKFRADSSSDPYPSWSSGRDWVLLLLGFFLWYKPATPVQVDPQLVRCSETVTNRSFVLSSVNPERSFYWQQGSQTAATENMLMFSLTECKKKIIYWNNLLSVQVSISEHSPGAHLFSWEM